jgi:cobalt-zinc-cadmium efflux system membrane fusion protein
MISSDQERELLRAQGDGHLLEGAAGSSASPNAPPARRKMGIGQKIVVAVLLTVVLVPPLAGFYSYFTGIPLHLLASSKEKETEKAVEPSASPSIRLVPGQAHTLEVPDEVCTTLGIRKGDQDAVAAAVAPTTMRPLVLPGSTAFDPSRLARIRARFAPARVVQLAPVWDYSRESGHTEYRSIRPGDPVSKGDLLGIFYSVDVGSKKNDLLQALVQLELDQAIMDKINENVYAIPAVYRLTQERAVQGDRTEINRALNNLKLWDIPQEEIDALQEEARKISADKDAWSKTPEGRWVNRVRPGKSVKENDNGSAHANGNGKDKAKDEAGKETENPWGRVTLHAPLDGIVVECNVRKDEMVVDNTINLFQVADVSRLLVIASCPEDSLPALESLHGNQRQWSVRTVGAGTDAGLPGTIDEIGYIIDPNQHTAIIKGYVDNPGKRIRAGQYVSATVKIPPPEGVVEIPTNALIDDGLQSIVFVQPDPKVHRFTMRRVHVTHRFEHSVFVRQTPIPKEEQLNEIEATEGLLPKEPLRPGDLVVLAGTVELKAALLDLESRHLRPETDNEKLQLAVDPKSRPETKAAKPSGGQSRSDLNPGSRPERKLKAVKG